MQYTFWRHMLTTVVNSVHATCGRVGGNTKETDERIRRILVVSLGNNLAE